MTRRPYQSLLTNEDRLTYRMWMRPVAVVYGSLALLMFGVATIRLGHSNDHDTANDSLIYGLALLWQILTRDRRSRIPKSVFL
jgi:hypothetical protein